LYTAYLIAAIAMTLSVLEGHHSATAGLFKCDLSYLWRVARFLCICRASCFDFFSQRSVYLSLFQVM